MNICIVKCNPDHVSTTLFITLNLHSICKQVTVYVIYFNSSTYIENIIHWFNYSYMIPIVDMGVTSWIPLYVTCWVRCLRRIPKLSELVIGLKQVIGMAYSNLQIKALVIWTGSDLCRHWSCATVNVPFLIQPQTMSSYQHCLEDVVLISFSVCLANVIAKTSLCCCVPHNFFCFSGGLFFK